jgi:hypothetical protein
MKTCALVLVPGIVTALWLAGCRSSVTVTAGRGGEGGAGGSTATGGWNTGGSGDSTGQGGAASGDTCGGPLDLPCRDDELCRFPPEASCGTAGVAGHCEPRPELCTQDCPGACGCDGRLHCNACMANAAGVNAAADDGVCTQAVTCEGVTWQIANQAAAGGMCTSVVRLDYQTRKLKAFHVACAPAAAVTPERARKRAEMDTGFGAEAQAISGLDPADEYVFWEPPSDHGGASAVSARNGATVFGGSIVMNEKGSVVHPTSFLHPASIGPGCGSSAAVPPARGLSLETLDELPASDVDAALSVVWTTALPDALATGSTLLDAMVLLYPPQVGVFDPEAAEWVVLLNSSALE